MSVNSSMKSCKITVIVSLMILLGVSSLVVADDKDVYDLNIEDLLNTEVTSVSKKAQRLSDAAAAIFVISNEDIRRSGVTSIPEALRMAPGINVARVDANKWAVSVRGFNGRFASKLLVLIDGRSVYTPAFSGVYWEMQDVMLEDVDRIEVIRGPGAALWGANAVNGVINIITQHSADTQGGLLTAGAGTEESGFVALRYGGQLTSNSTGRAYIKSFKRDGAVSSLGKNTSDDWDKIQSGFRLDAAWSDRDLTTFQGDVYYSNLNQDLSLALLAEPYLETKKDSVTALGGNLLARLQHSFSSSSDYIAQFYYDFYNRSEGFSHEIRHTLDIEFQHSFQVNSWNDTMWGMGYRYTHDDMENTFVFSVDPESRSDQLFTAFLQDELTLIDSRLWLTLGSRFEHNDYIGFEIQPTARLMWKPHQQHRVWAAVSRTVRTPARINHDASYILSVLPPNSSLNPLSLPLVVQAIGNSSFKSEELLTYELGYRVALTKYWSLDLTAFYNNYDSLLDVNQETPSISINTVNQRVVINNNSRAETYGFELTSVWQMMEWWQWNFNYSFIKYQFHEFNITTTTTNLYEPQQTVSIQSQLSFWNNIEIDVWLKYVDQLSRDVFPQAIKINEYTILDVRMAWKPKSNIEISIVGQNLLDSHHPEYVKEFFTVPSEVERGVYGKIKLRF